MFDFRQVSILCVGDVMLDRFVYGQVERVSPESPIPVLKMQRSFDVVGGAGNVARNLSSLGAHVELMGVVGNDTQGESITQLLGTDANIQAHLITDPLRPTTFKTRFVAQGQQLLRVDGESSSTLDASGTQQIITRAEKIIENVKLLILSDYAKGVLTPELCQKLIQMANQRGIPVVVDPKGRDLSRYAGAHFITPNLKEIHDVNDEIPFQELCEDIHHKWDIKNILITQGPAGMTLFRPKTEPLHIDTVAREVFDVSGAGDTVVATLSACLAANYTPEQACRIANTAAGIVVGKAGTATVHIDELNLMYTNPNESQKIGDLAHILNLTQKWRREGLKIGFTNGCFDLLHQGHLHILREAAKTCDRLIVAINSDASVQRLKGPSRPIQDETARCEIVSSLEMVDAVILFHEETPQTLIEAILPDVLIKGADYTVDKVAGSQIVISNGGKVVLVPLKQGHSTTETLKRFG